MKENHISCPLCYGTKRVIHLITNEGFVEVDCPACDEDAEISMNPLETSQQAVVRVLDSFPNHCSV